MKPYGVKHHGQFKNNDFPHGECKCGICKRRSRRVSVNTEKFYWKLRRYKKIARRRGKEESGNYED